ncbi:MAG: hypothetical protein KA230_02065 [Flavobacteriales bacterium]|nr:hypothetical protein [Flavobacteriales bacterium]MBP6573210.1 hypothetical protein [Flavobacteriales bacterium]
MTAGYLDSTNGPRKRMEQQSLFTSAERARSLSAIRREEHAAHIPSTARALSLQKASVDTYADLRDPEFWGLCLLGALLVLFA